MEITKNKKAFFDYDIIETDEAGIELKGYEVKSIRNKHVNLKGAYIVERNTELFVKSMHVTALKSLAHRESVDVERERKIFLPKKRIVYYSSKMKEGGYSLVPLELYFKGSLIKMRVALAKGKKAYQKKQVLKERTLDKEAKMFLKKNY